MAIFPQIPRDIDTELFVNGVWTDVTSDVYARDGMTITRGGQDETSRIGPSRCQFTLNNRTGKYSPRNPNSLFYGSLGRNTPMRVAIGKDTDTFTRTVSSGWGSTDLGTAWSTFSTGGTISASDYNVSGGVGTQSVPVVNGTRATYLPGQLYGDVDVAVTASVPLATITGGSVAPANIMVRGVDANNYALVFLEAFTDGLYYISLYDVVGGSAIQLTTGQGTGITHASGKQVRVRASVDGSLFRAKAWVASAGEPYGWNALGATSFTAPGWVGVQSFIQGTNTNTVPVVFSNDNFVVRVPRYAGEVSYWPQRWDTSGRDVYVPIEAAGIKRRLGQGAAPLVSAMLNQITRQATVPVAYWPCEEGSDSTQINALIGGNQLLVSGTTKFASFTGFPSSQPLPALNVGTWTGRVAPYTSSGYVAVSFLFHVPSSEPPDASPIIQLFTSGTAPQYEVRYSTGGFFRIVVIAPSGTLFDSGPLTFVNGTDNLIDTRWLVSLLVHQNGSNVDFVLSAIKVGDPISTNWSGTVTSRTMGTATRVVIDPLQKLRDVTVGHLTVWNTNFDVFDLVGGFNAYSGPVEIGGETAVARMTALCSDAGVAFAWQGNGPTSALVGAQRPLSLLTILEDSADADMGLLHETRNHFGLFYRTRTSLYNQTPALTLDYSAGQVSPPLEPVDDDQQTRNDIVAQRTDGAQFELFLSSGRLSVIDPWNGGVGTYQDQATLNVDFDTQLPDAAGWRLLLGTVDEARYPTIKVDLANPNVVTAGLDNTAMSVDVGDRIVVTNPPTFSTPDQISQIVRGYTETLNVFEHTITFVCAPASPYDVIRAGASGKMTLDSDASTLTSSVTTTATSLSVTTTAGSAPWVTGAVSFDLLVEGERITVTNISGASSPQTFTVTRSINGIVKTHSAGAAVRLFRPSLLAL